MDRKLAFLDRDGVLNKELGNYVCKKEDFVVLDHGIVNCKILQEKGYELIMITNQGGIAKQLYTEAQLKEMHHILLQRYQQEGVDFLEVYYCPHHSIIENCLCRKPKGLMLEKAMAKFKVNPDLCFLIGDNQRDIQAAHAAGVKNAYEIESNEDWKSIALEVR